MKSKIIRFSVGIAVLVLLLYHVGFNEIISLLEMVDYGYVLIAFLLFIISIILAAVNLRMMIRPLKMIPLRHFIDYYLVTRVSSLFLPGRLGEFSMVYFLKREKINIGKGTAAIIMDKFITLLCSTIIGTIGVLILFKKQISLLILLAAGAVILSVIIIIGEKVINKYLQKKFASVVTDFSETLRNYRKKYQREILANGLLTLGRFGIIAFSAHYMFLALHIDVSSIWILLIGGIEVLTTVVPITINGLGIKQSVGVYMYSIVGVTAEITAARYIIGLIIQYGFGLLSLVFIRRVHHETTH
ncbi:MAG: hypothetical protein CMH61_01140 [Nanoarchaeota archaeon]|nr:hypothetical protein [Nanoarchaeota archaeon]